MLECMLPLFKPDIIIMTPHWMPESSSSTVVEKNNHKHLDIFLEETLFSC